MKKKTMIISIVALIVGLISVGVVAYFTTERTIRGTITSGYLKLKVYQETLDEGQIINSDLKIMPGDVIDRIITIENIGTESAYLRIKVVTTVDDEDLSAQECIDMNIDEEYWTYKEGYYYYYKALEPGERSRELFTQVYISGEKVDNKYLGKTFSLDIVAQATQSKNNSDNALDAYGWPE